MSHPLEGKKILLVDDDQDVLTSMAAAFEPTGAVIETAANGNKAVELAEKIHPDVIILDMMLPGRSGFLVLDSITNMKVKTGQPKSGPPFIIMITGNPGSRHKAFAQSLGVLEYFNKPVKLEKLISAAERLIAPEALNRPPSLKARGIAMCDCHPARYNPHMSTDPTPIPFETWWHTFGSALPTDNPELFARSTWDAAIFSAAKILQARKDQLVSEQDYQQAALTRDLLHLLDAAFTTPGQWNPRRAEQIEWHRQRLRKLSTPELQNIVPTDNQCEFDIALKEIKRERQNAPQRNPPD